MTTQSHSDDDDDDDGGGATTDDNATTDDDSSSSSSSSSSDSEDEDTRLMREEMERMRQAKKAPTLSEKELAALERAKRAQEEAQAGHLLRDAEEAKLRAAQELEAAKARAQAEAERLAKEAELAAQEAEAAKRKAEKKARKAQLKLEAEEAARVQAEEAEAARVAEEARILAEKEAEAARRQAEKEAEAARIQAEKEAEAARMEFEKQQAEAARIEAEKKAKAERYPVLLKKLNKVEDMMDALIEEHGQDVVMKESKEGEGGVAGKFQTLEKKREEYLTALEDYDTEEWRKEEEARANRPPKVYARRRTVMANSYAALKKRLDEVVRQQEQIGNNQDARYIALEQERQSILKGMERTPYMKMIRAKEAEAREVEEEKARLAQKNAMTKEEKLAMIQAKAKKRLQEKQQQQK